MIIQDSGGIRRLLARSRVELYYDYQLALIRADWNLMGLNAGLLEVIEG